MSIVPFVLLPLTELPLDRLLLLREAPIRSAIRSLAMDPIGPSTRSERRSLASPEIARSFSAVSSLPLVVDLVVAEGRRPRCNSEALLTAHAPAAAPSKKPVLNFTPSF